MKILIREEAACDFDPIDIVTGAAFAGHPYSHQTEVYIIHALRAAGALSLSLVAEVDGAIVGHVAFSPVSIADGVSGWYGVGPLSVLPAHQRRGVGTALMQEALATLRRQEAQGCVLVGDPAYYVRFGFKNIPELTLEGVPPENFLALPYTAEIPVGAVSFHEGFGATGP